MSTATLEKSMVDYSTVPTSTTTPQIVAQQMVAIIKELPVRTPQQPASYAERKLAEITPVEAKQFAEILTAAAERLRTKGWTRGTVGSAAGPNCAVGAVENTTELLNLRVQRGIDFLPVLERLYSAVLVYGGVPHLRWFPGSFGPGAGETARNSVIAWNDGAAKQSADVILAFETTAAELTAKAA